MDVPRSTCKRLAWRVRRIYWISWLYLKMLANEWCSLLWAKSYTNNKVWHSYKSLSFNILDCLNRSSVWLLYFALFIVWIAHLCSNSVLYKTDWLAFPHAKIPHVRCGWMTAKPSILKLSTRKICLTSLMENEARYNLLLVCLKWYFHDRYSSSKIHKILVNFLLTAKQFLVF